MMYRRIYSGAFSSGISPMKGGGKHICESFQTCRDDIGNRYNVS